MKQLSHCPSVYELTHASIEGTSPTLEKHLLSCRRCQSLMNQEQQAASLMSLLSRRESTSTQHQEAKLALLSAAAMPALPARSTRGLWLSLFAAVILLSGGLYLFLKPSPAQQRGTIYAGDGARFVHQQQKGDEIVRLTNGSITVKVEHLKSGERFRVIIGDAEVEVHGTSFEVAANDDQLVSVRVLEGLVEVRHKESPPKLLTYGERWLMTEAKIAPSSTESRPIVIAPTSLPSEPTSTPTSSPVLLVREEPKITPVASPKLAPVTSAPVAPSFDATYRAAFEALRAHDYVGAARGFEAVSASSDKDLAEDASFWYASALDQGKDPGASRAFENFLRRYPTSPRANEARLLLGKLLIEAGSLTEAKALFQEVEESAPEALKRLAKEGLKTIEKRQTSPQ